MTISSDVHILTTAELDKLKGLSFQRGVHRGQYEAAGLKWRPAYLAPLDTDVRVWVVGPTSPNGHALMASRSTHDGFWHAPYNGTSYTITDKVLLYIQLPPDPDGSEWSMGDEAAATTQASAAAAKVKASGG